MEDTSRSRQRPIHVERAFAGSRLEKQILIRVYELAAPIICNRIKTIPLPDPSDQIVNDLHQSQCVTRGA